MMRLPLPLRLVPFFGALALGLAACTNDLGGPSDPGTGGGGSGFATSADSATLVRLAGTTYDAWLSNIWFFSLMDAVPSVAPARAREFLYNRIRSPGSTSYVDLCPSAVITGLDDAGRPIDVDGDGSADDLLVRFGDDCRFANAEGTASWILSGSVRQRDIRIPGRGFEYMMDDFKYTRTDLETGITSVEGVNGRESLVLGPGLETHTMQVGLEWASYGGNAPASQYVLMIDGWSTLVPDPGTRYVYGDIEPVGATIESSAEFRIHDRRGSATAAPDVHLVLTTTAPMHYDWDQCSMFDFDRGAVRGVLSEAPTVGFAIDWSGGCDAGALTIFGNTE